MNQIIEKDTSSQSAQTANAHPAKKEWVTPCVSEFGLTDTTHAAVGAGGDLGLYS
jgi:hypothetical protein